MDKEYFSWENYVSECDVCPLCNCLIDNEYYLNHRYCHNSDVMCLDCYNYYTEYPYIDCANCDNFIASRRCCCCNKVATKNSTVYYNVDNDEEYYFCYDHHFSIELFMYKNFVCENLDICTKCNTPRFFINRNKVCSMCEYNIEMSDNCDICLQNCKSYKHNKRCPMCANLYICELCDKNFECWNCLDSKVMNRCNLCKARASKTTELCYPCSVIDKYCVVIHFRTIERLVLSNLYNDIINIMILGWKYDNKSLLSRLPKEIFMVIYRLIVTKEIFG